MVGANEQSHGVQHRQRWAEAGSLYRCIHASQQLPVCCTGVVPLWRRPRGASKRLLGCAAAHRRSTCRQCRCLQGDRGVASKTGAKSRGRQATREMLHPQDVRQATWESRARLNGSIPALPPQPALAYSEISTCKQAGAPCVRHKGRWGVSEDCNSRHHTCTYRMRTRMSAVCSLVWRCLGLRLSGRDSLPPCTMNLGMMRWKPLFL